MLFVAGLNANAIDEEDAAQQADEGAVPVRAAHRERQDEHAEQRAVEDRSDPVHDLDQRSELHGHVRDDAGDDAPEGDGEAGEEQVVRVALGLVQQPLVDVNHRGGRRGAQLAGGGRHRRGEDRGDDQPDQPLRQPRRHERRKDVVHVGLRRVAGLVAVVGDAGHILDYARRAAADRRHLDRRRAELLARRVVLGPVAVAIVVAADSPPLVRLREIRLQRVVVGRARALLDLRRVLGVEQHRRLVEHVEQEHEDADHQDEHLQRDLHERAHQERVARLVQRLRGEVALHLALVAPEVRQVQEQPADEARPERVGLLRIEVEVDGVEPAGGARHVQRLPDADVVRQAEDQEQHRAHQAADDDAHLLDVGPRDRLHAAEHRVEDGRPADREDRQRQVPVKHDREDDRGRRDDRAGRHAPAKQEQQARERPRLHVEPPLEVLVRRVDARPVEERHERHRQDHHRERQAEVELDEAHAVGIRLAGRADQRDGAELRRHHRQADRPPRQAAVGEQVPFDAGAGLGPPQAVDDDPEQVADDNEPVE